MARGIPKDTNPFLCVWRECVDDPILADEAPRYFCLAAGGDIVHEIQRKASRISQKRAEALVRRIVTTLTRIPTTGVVECLVVKEAYAHIIPADLRTVVRLTKRTEYPVSEVDCYIKF